MANKKKKKKITNFDISQKIRQRLRADFGATEDQIDTIEHLLKGYMPNDDVEFISQIERPTVNHIPPPSIKLEMEDGNTQDITITDNPLSRLYDYCRTKYGEKFGPVYWGAYTSVDKQQDFYSLLGMLVERPTLK